MYSPCSAEVSQACHGCCLNPFTTLTYAPNPNRSTPCREFLIKTTSSLFPNTHFTNHESLPSLSDCFHNFSLTYPQYLETNTTDQIRAQEYSHLSLSNHVCFDYIGFGLFSHSQQPGMLASSSSSAPASYASPFFNISYKSASPTIQFPEEKVRNGDLESSIRERIMKFLHISESDYIMVFTVNRASAFSLLAESYPFQKSKRLLTVYDYHSEGLNAMVESSKKRGARILSASFTWPCLRIHSQKLKKLMVNQKRQKKRKQGLFVFPLQSRLSGARYSYLWMSRARENGWDVLLDACSLGPKDMDTLGLSLFQPEFVVCSFFKVFGEDPSGFSCLFVNKTRASALQAPKSIRIIRIVPAKNQSWSKEDESSSSSKENITHILESEMRHEEDNLSYESSFSGPLSLKPINHQGERNEQEASPQLGAPVENVSNRETPSEIVESEDTIVIQKKKTTITKTEMHQNTEKGTRRLEIECRCLDHADKLGLPLISSRVRYLVNWLVTALLKLRHPNSEAGGLPLVRIYGPRIKFNRGPAVAFNVFDWKGEKVEPVLVQKLADRSNLSLSYCSLCNIWFQDKHEEDKEVTVEATAQEATLAGKREKVDLGVTVVTVTVSFLSNFEDMYRLWAFVARFLDADFVEKERWRYLGLNQKMIEV
ncbi:uncharacterized protein LOC18447802 [Amborella trichopoda]|nr:uncharacterized protein LOC18447802 [Amborella trichopoda]|eukprot:XP_006857951.2 uncharacterized protein LOC18447802 [Amborella trichopoda]